jgi:hypothetical protein
VRHAGNIKIDARLRAEGQVVFSYYEDRAPWLEDSEGTALALGPLRGVTVEKLEPLAYRVSYGKKSVVFALNDLSQVKPRRRRWLQTINSSVRCSTNRRSGFSWCSMRN